MTIDPPSKLAKRIAVEENLRFEEAYRKLSEKLYNAALKSHNAEAFYIALSIKAHADALNFIAKYYANVEEIYMDRLKMRMDPQLSELDHFSDTEISVIQQYADLIRMFYSNKASYYNIVARIIWELVYVAEYKKRHGYITYYELMSFDYEIEKIAQCYAAKYIRKEWYLIREED